MKSRTSTCITVMTLFVVLALSIQVAAQDNTTQANQPKHRHYKLIDLGTLGGPNSYGDAGHNAGNINNRGIAVGVADTTAANPYYPNFNPATFQDPFVYHAFEWNNGALVDLGALPGGNSSNPNFISESGLVVGASLDGAIDAFGGWPEVNAVLWRDGQIINLGTLGYESAANSVNSRGQVAGIATNAIPDPFSIFYFAFFGLSNGTQTRAILWDSENSLQDLGTPGGPDAFALFINERGQIAGFSYTNSTPNSTTGVPTLDPFRWEDDKMIDLGTLGGTNGSVGGLNNHGQVIGTSNLAGDVIFHPFLWTAPGPMRDLGTLGGSFGFANAINEAGAVVGQAATTGDQALHAFVWKRGVLTDLGTLANYDASCIGAFDINSKDQVVGQAVENFCAGPGAHAFLWENGHIIDLNVFVPPGSNLILGDSEKLNDRGEIFGSALLPNGDNHAFLLIPVCEDGTEGCADAPLDPVLVAQSRAASGAASKTMTAEELAAFKERIAHMHAGWPLEIVA